jgi:two-component system response regulator AlgR
MKVLIVDDEPPARERLRQLLEDTGEHELVGEAGNGREALDIAASNAPDVVLLDIRMPGMDGIETAQHLNRAEVPPAIVFTTAYDEYAIDAFEANAIGYVLKPIRRERLDQALSQAARLTSSALADVGRQSGGGRRKHLCARLHDELKLIPVVDVHYFVADQKYVSVVHREGRDLIEDSLKSLETEFEDLFVRIHRGAVVAVSAIDSLKKDDDGRTRVMLRAAGADDDDLIVSRRHVADVKRRLKKG